MCKMMLSRLTGQAAPTRYAALDSDVASRLTLGRKDDDANPERPTTPD
jgi:hypothetical protein